jgi:ribonuclease Z
MSLSIRLLGTSASRPTVERNVASLAIVREGETLLFDCGEGTQRQMMRYGVSFSLGDIFFTHFHADHVIGVIGLMRTMSLQGRTEPLRLWGPRGAVRTLKRAEDFGMDRLSFPIEVAELDPEQRIARKDYAIVPYAAMIAAPGRWATRSLRMIGRDASTPTTRASWEFPRDHSGARSIVAAR